MLFHQTRALIIDLFCTQAFHTCREIFIFVTHSSAPLLTCLSSPCFSQNLTMTWMVNFQSFQNRFRFWVVCQSTPKIWQFNHNGNSPTCINGNDFCLMWVGLDIVELRTQCPNGNVPLYVEQRINATMLREDVVVVVKPDAEVGRRVIGRWNARQNTNFTTSKDFPQTK